MSEPRPIAAKPGSAPGRRQEAWAWLAWLALAAAIGLAWSNSLEGAFTYDDKVEVIGNRTIRALEHWDAILTYNLSRPLVIGTYALNFHFSRFEPLAYHVVDVVLHALSAGAALLLVTTLAELRGLARPVRIGAIAAGLWALHPLQTESVSYVTGRSEQIVGIFYLLGALAWARSLAKPGFWRGGGWRGWLGAHLALGMGALSKEVIYTLPVALLLIEWLAARGGRLRSIQWARYLPLGLSVVGLAWLRVRLYGAVVEPEVSRPWDVQVWTEVEVLWRYVQLSILPVGQSIFHDHPETGPTARSAAALAGLIASTTGALWLGLRGPADRKIAPMLALGWLWFLLILAPSSIVPLKETMAEHRAHASLLGLAWIAALGLGRLRWGGPAALALCAALAAGTWHRNTLWQTEPGIWGEAIARSPESPEAWYGYGDALRYSERCGEALDAYRRSRDLDPSLADAWINEGICQAILGDLEDAEATWLETLSRFPSACKAHNNLGLLRTRQGEHARAANDFRTALTYCPQSLRSHHWLGDLCYEHLDDPECALAHYEYLLELDPAYAFEVEIRRRILELTW